MFKELFPSGLAVDFPNLNLEVVLHHLQQWNLEAVQMQKGQFSATISAIHTPRIQLHDINYSHGFMVRGGFPENCVMLGYIKTKAKVVFQNRVQGALTWNIMATCITIKFAIIYILFKRSQNHINQKMVTTPRYRFTKYIGNTVIFIRLSSLYSRSRVACSLAMRPKACKRPEPIYKYRL